jgi:hypothetical protein
MVWIRMSRRTGEAGTAETGSAPVWVNSDSIQFIQAQGGGTRIYLRDGALETIDVTEAPEEILRDSR